MKVTPIVLAVCLWAGLSGAFAQAPSRYQTAMAALLGHYDTTNAKVDHVKEANAFVRIAEAEKTQWLPYYYAAYHMVLESMSQSDLTKVDLIADQAEKYLDQADLLSAKNSEVYCLRSMVILNRIRVNQMERGMNGLMAAQAALENAQAYDPQNPRVYFMLGQQAYNTPTAFGGSKQVALHYFEKAQALLEAQKGREATIDVHWGRQVNGDMVTQCRKKLAIAEK
jgi:D-alanyl-D-alanine dipeptidase